MSIINEEKREKQRRKILEKIFSPLWFAGILFVPVAIAWLFVPNITVTREEVEVTILNSTLLTILLLVVYYFPSFRIFTPVKSNEIGIKIFLGKPFAEIGSGPPFAPRGLVSVQTVSRSFQQREFPAEPEKIWRPAKGETAAAPPKEFKPPVRITFGEVVEQGTARILLGTKLDEDIGGSDIKQKEKVADRVKHYKKLIEDLQDENAFYNWSEKEPPELPEHKGNDEEYEKELEKSLKGCGKIYTFNPGTEHDKKEKAEGLSRRVTAEVSVVLRWRVIKTKGIDYIVNIGDEKNLAKQAEDEMVGILQRLLPIMSVGQALQNIAWINAILKRKVEARTHDWGVEVNGAYLKQIQFHRDLNSAIADRGEAFYEASADKERIVRKGEGDAAAAAALEREVLEARAQGYKQIALTINVSGAEVQAAEVARNVGEGEGTVVIGTDGFRDLVGIGKVLAQSNQKKEKGGE